MRVCFISGSGFSSGYSNCNPRTAHCVIQAWRTCVSCSMKLNVGHVAMRINVQTCRAHDIVHTYIHIIIYSNNDYNQEFVMTSLCCNNDDVIVHSCNMSDKCRYVCTMIRIRLHIDLPWPAFYIHMFCCHGRWF